MNGRQYRREKGKAECEPYLKADFYVLGLNITLDVTAILNSGAQYGLS
jgi:hypothetical protein